MAALPRAGGGNDCRQPRLIRRVGRVSGLFRTIQVCPRTWRSPGGKLKVR